MIKKEVTEIIRQHMRKLTINIKNMAHENKTADRIFITERDLYELRAICILAICILSYHNLTGVDLQERSFDDANSN